MNPRAIYTVAATFGLPLILLPACILALPVSAQNRSDRERNGLNGPVRSVRFEKADAAKGSIAERMLFSEDCYDQVGNRVVCGKVESNAVIAGNKRIVTLFAGTHTYSYDTEGRLAEVVVSDADGSLFSREAYHYDEHGFMVERHGYGGDGIEGRDVLTYDGNGNLLREVDFKSPPGGGPALPGFKWTYAYSPAGMLIETAYYKLTGDGEECTGKSVNRYAQNGTLATQERHGTDGSLEYRESYSRIKLDSQGNWVERYVSRRIRDGKRMKQEPDQIQYRTITYY